MSVQPQKHSLPSHQLPSKPVPTSPRPTGSQAWGRAGRRLPEKWGRVGYKCPRRTRPWTQISWVGWVPLAVLVSQKGRLRARRIPQERPRPHPGLAEARNLHAPYTPHGDPRPLGTQEFAGASGVMLLQNSPSVSQVHWVLTAEGAPRSPGSPRG